MAGKWWLILFILLGFSSYGQYVYTYTDPCTGVLNSVTISQPSGSVTLFYAGQYNTFTQAQLQSGGFEAWVQQINALAPPGSNPCAGAGGTISTGSNASTGTNTATNVSGIIGIATGISGNIGGSAASTGTGGISTNTGSNGSSSNNDNGNGSSGNSSSGNSSTGGSSTGGSGSSSGGGNNTGNGGGSGSTGGNGGGSGSTGSGGGNGSTGSGSSGGGQSGDNSGTGIGGGGEAGGVDTGGGTGGTTETGGSESGAVGGNESTTTASGGDSESGGDDGGGGGGGSKRKSKQEKVGRGSLIGSGDFVIIRNGNDIKATGMDNFRFNTSITHINTKQNFIKGANLNYTTGENTANLTLYGSYKTETFMGIFSNSVMTNFKSDIFNTTTALAAQRLWKFTFMGGTNFTFGKIGESDFQNWSIVGGAFTNFSGSRVFSANIMALGIYSPYIFYYEGQWYKSGILLVPLANCDFKITDRFKWSLSFSGAYQWQADILNFQLSTGTKILL